MQPRHSNRKPLRTRIRYTDIGSCWSAARKLLHVSAYLDDAPLHRALSRGRFAGWSHSLYPIGAHPPLEPPSWRVSLSSSPSSRGFFYCLAQVLPWQISLHPRFYALMATTTTSMGLPSAPPSFLLYPSYTFPPPLFLCCTTRLNGIGSTCPFFSSFVLGVLAFGLMGFVRIRMGKNVCVYALCDFWPWWEFCEELAALQYMRCIYFFDKKGFLPFGLNYFFFFFFWNFELEMNLRFKSPKRLKFMMIYYNFNILVSGKLVSEIWDFEFENWFF